MHSKNVQLAINMVASLTTFAVNFGINFFLTPFIVGSLGVAAYGFVGLSNNIISYTQLVTLALNSMAARFISIKYMQGDITSANKYFSSVFYSNLALSVVLLLIMLGCVFYLECIFDIPENIVCDVKVLFFLLAINSILGLMSNVYAIATFIKNRLELSSIRQIIGYIIRAIALFGLFYICTPHLWYIGITGIFVTLYTAVTNYKYTSILTPELKIKKIFYDWSKVIELVKSGAWNLVSKLGEILGQGLDLVIANLFIGATAMGVFSLTKNIPILVLSLFQMIANVFAPILTQLYAKGKKKDLCSELKKTIRILGFFTTIPLSLIFIWGDSFYKLWIPSEDSALLQLLTIFSCIGMVFAMPLEALWNIFTITNKLKYSSIIMLVNNILVFLTVIISVYYTDDLTKRLLILASTRSIWGILRSLTFLPLYGAHCLNISYKTFYPPILKSLLSFIVILFIGFFLKQYYVVDNWIDLLIIALVIITITIICNLVIVLTHSDRAFIKYKIFKLQHH